MVQTAQPHEQAEDPMGMQRPTDRDAATAAEEFADALSELPEARLVSTPGRPKEVLLSDDPPELGATGSAVPRRPGAGERLRYPEWDCRARRYREPRRDGALRARPRAGPQAMGGRGRCEQPADGNADESAGASRCCARSGCGCASSWTATRSTSMPTSRPTPTSAPGCRWRSGCTRPSAQARRDMAIMLLVDVSGSTDGWIAADKRVIDVEREALLLVCIALQGMAEPYAVLAFSGEGPHGGGRSQRQALRRSLSARRGAPDRRRWSRSTTPAPARRCGTPPRC